MMKVWSPEHEAMKKISVRIPIADYIALKELVENGIFSTISEAVREAIYRLVKELGET